MTDTTTVDLASWLTAVWDEEERLAKAAISPARDGLTADSGVWETFHSGGIEDAASGDVIVYDEGAPTSEQADFIVAHDPASVLARIAAVRKILERVQMWKHRVVDEDCWFTCPAATEERDGGDTCNDDERGKPCTCGLEWRQMQILGPLASPYKGREGWQEAWE